MLAMRLPASIHATIQLRDAQHLSNSFFAVDLPSLPPPISRLPSLPTSLSCLLPRPTGRSWGSSCQERRKLVPPRASAGVESGGPLADAGEIRSSQEDGSADDDVPLLTSAVENSLHSVAVSGAGNSPGSVTNDRLPSPEASSEAEERRRDKSAGLLQGVMEVGSSIILATAIAAFGITAFYHRGGRVASASIAAPAGTSISVSVEQVELPAMAAEAQTSAEDVDDGVPSLSSLSNEASVESVVAYLLGVGEEGVVEETTADADSLSAGATGAGSGESSDAADAADGAEGANRVFVAAVVENSDDGVTEVLAAIDIPKCKQLAESPLRGVGGPISAVDPAQLQAMEALQILKVMEENVDPLGICSRREFARWLVASSHVLSRTSAQRVFPAIFVPGHTVAAYDDVPPSDPDFVAIQGLAEAGLIPSRLIPAEFKSSVAPSSPSSSASTAEVEGESVISKFCPDSPITRQELLGWKLALDCKDLPPASLQDLQKKASYLDLNTVDLIFLPAIAYDSSSGGGSITALAFGLTRRLEPRKPVTHAQAAAVLAAGEAAEMVTEELARMDAEKIAVAAVEVVEAAEAAAIRAEKEAEGLVSSVVEEEKVKREDAEKVTDSLRFQLKVMEEVRQKEQESLALEKVTVVTEREMIAKIKEEAVEQIAALASMRQQVQLEHKGLQDMNARLQQEKEVMAAMAVQVEVEKRALAMTREWAEREAMKSREEALQLQAARMELLASAAQPPPSSSSSDPPPSVLAGKEEQPPSAALSSAAVTATAGAQSSFSGEGAPLEDQAPPPGPQLLPDIEETSGKVREVLLARAGMAMRSVARQAGEVGQAVADVAERTKAKTEEGVQEGVKHLAGQLAKILQRTQSGGD